MPDNKQIIEKFYNSFMKLDYMSMNSCYSDDIVFHDPVFLLLRGEEVKYMWEMLCTNARDFSLSFSDIELLDEEYATCWWTASYTFSKTGRRVTNHIKAFMKIRDGKITEHSDAFRLSTWATQAIGWKGALFGWMGWFQRRIQKNARKSLEKFIMQKSGLF